jgi:hypothetical protein
MSEAPTQPIRKISLERILAERHGDNTLTPIRKDYHRQYMRKWRAAKNNVARLND